jgi:hypothetical protein
MTEERLPLAKLLAKAGDGDFLRSVAEAVVGRVLNVESPRREGELHAGVVNEVHDLE